MRYRALDANDDMTFGHGQQNFLVDSPAAVAQSVKTRLRMATGEWFYDISDGTPYIEQILGNQPAPVYDYAIRSRILGTQGVKSIDEYSSSLVNRILTVEATISTIFGQADLTVQL